MKFAASLLTLASVLALWPSAAEARKFDFKTETFATYFGGTFGNSKVGNQAYAGSSGTDVTTDKTVQTTSSGDFGILLTGSKFAFRLGVEIIWPKAQTGIIGTNAAGTELFYLDSDIMALTPMANLELVAFQTSESRFSFGGGYGMAFVTLDNTYDMTPAGVTALGKDDFIESASARVPAMQGYMIFETLFTDTVTASITVGYRHIQVPSMKSTKATTALSGDQTDSTDIKNMDGTNRSFDLSGPFAGIAFRFYLGGS